MYIALSSCTYLKEQHFNVNIYENKIAKNMQLLRPQDGPRMTWTLARRLGGQPLLEKNLCKTYAGMDLGHLLELRP
jgi:hypothetical protein